MLKVDADMSPNHMAIAETKWPREIPAKYRRISIEAHPASYYPSAPLPYIISQNHLSLEEKVHCQQLVAELGVWSDTAD